MSRLESAGRQYAFRLDLIGRLFQPSFAAAGALKLSLWGAIGLLGWLGSLSPAAAHGLTLKLMEQSGEIVGLAMYSDGTPAAGEPVAIARRGAQRPASGDRPGDASSPRARQEADSTHKVPAQPLAASVELPVADLRTDAKGSFRWKPLEHGTFVASIEAIEGHRAEATIEIRPSDLTAGAPGRGADHAHVDAQALSDQILAIRQDIQRLETRLRLGDWMAGIGLIIGLAGGFAWWQARRVRP